MKIPKYNPLFYQPMFKCRIQEMLSITVPISKRFITVLPTTDRERKSNKSTRKNA